jgi:hypothetical protein
MSMLVSAGIIPFARIKLSFELILKYQETREKASKPEFWVF